MRPTVRGPRRVTIYQSCLRLSAVIRNGARYMSISVAVPFRQLRRIAKSAAVPSPSCVADAGVRRVRSISRLNDMCDQVGWRCRQPRDSKSSHIVLDDLHSSVGAAQTDRLLPAHCYLQLRHSARILPGLPVRPYTRAVIAPFRLHQPSYLHPRSSDSTPALGPPLFLRSLLVFYVEGPVD